MTNVMPLLEFFFILCGVGAVASFFAPAGRSPAVLAVIGSIAALVILMTSAWLLIGDATFHAKLWVIPSLGTLTLGTDRLSAFFLFVSGLIFLPVSSFSGFYLKKYIGHYDLRYFSVLFHALFASIVLIVIADDAVSFLIAWEAMSIISYLLVAYEYDHEDSSHAAMVMLAMSEVGAIMVVIAFILASRAAGALNFVSFRLGSINIPENIRWAVFLLSFFGFAVKAGLTPVNSWLPLAHPVAPTNVSALLSTVIVNLGIYGIVRMNLDLVPVREVGPGLVILVTGSISALLGILYATIQSEMKRLLAHSTIENMGIVTAAIGASMVFISTGHNIVAGIAIIAALYHLLNHAVYKALLFMGVGAVEAGTGTRDLDRLGGIIHNMPWTSAFVLVGVLSISALPPLNGFVSEWLTLQTILRSVVLSSVAVKITFAISGALLALTAGLAVTCFAKFYAMGFLGLPRSERAAHAAETSPGMRAPLALLAASCIALGLLPTYVIPALNQAAEPLVHANATTALVPPFFSQTAQQQEKLPPTFLSDFHNIGAQIGGAVLPGRGLVVLLRGGSSNPVVFAMATFYAFIVLTIVLALTFIVFQFVTRHRSVMRGAAWYGGLRQLGPSASYMATGFSNPVRVIFQVLLHPTATEDSTEAVARHFRTAIRREQTEVYIVDRWVLQPPVRALRQIANVVRKMHVGHVNAYAAYVLATLLAVLIIGAALH